MLKRRKQWRIERHYLPGHHQHYGGQRCEPTEGKLKRVNLTVEPVEKVPRDEVEQSNEKNRPLRLRYIQRSQA